MSDEATIRAALNEIYAADEGTCSYVLPSPLREDALAALARLTAEREALSEPEESPEPAMSSGSLSAGGACTAHGVYDGHTCPGCLEEREHNPHRHVLTWMDRALDAEALVWRLEEALRAARTFVDNYYRDAMAHDDDRAGEAAEAVLVVIDAALPPQADA